MVLSSVNTCGILCKIYEYTAERKTTLEKETLARLKKEKDAVILAHYYVDGAVQEIADHVGDSFTLAKIATGIDAKTIVMAGVEFMGETVKILNPEKEKNSVRELRPATTMQLSSGTASLKRYPCPQNDRSV